MKNNHGAHCKSHKEWSRCDCGVPAHLVEPDVVRWIRSEVAPYEPGDGPTYQGTHAEIAVADLLDYIDVLHSRMEVIEQELDEYRKDHPIKEEGKPE